MREPRGECCQAHNSSANRDRIIAELDLSLREDLTPLPNCGRPLEKILLRIPGEREVFLIENVILNHGFGGGKKT